MSRARLSHVGILLGSNIQPEENLARAARLLAEHFQHVQVSRAWESPAVGSEGPDFMNAAILAYTALRPNELKLTVLRPLEAKLGRVRSGDKYAPRTIDLDIAVWGTRTLDENIWRFAFAALPIAELLPELRCGDRQETLAQTAHRLAEWEPIRVREDVTEAIMRQNEQGRGGFNVKGLRLKGIANLEIENGG